MWLTIIYSDVSMVVYIVVNSTVNLLLPSGKLRLRIHIPSGYLYKMGLHGMYPLVNVYISNRKITMLSLGKLTLNGSCSIAMCCITKGLIKSHA